MLLTPFIYLYSKSQEKIVLNFPHSKVQLSLVIIFFFEGVKEFDARWIGWAGVNVPDSVGQKALTKALAEKVQNSWFPLEIFAGLKLISWPFISSNIDKDPVSP